MKKIITFSIAILFSIISMAQNSEATMNDTDRIAIGVKMDNINLSEKLTTKLSSRINQLITSNGLGHDEKNSFFYIEPQISLISNEITSTQPAYHVYIIELTLNVKDALRKNIYSSITKKYKGVGRSKEEAYMKALNRIKPRKSYNRAFIRKAKKNIISFYNTDIKFILTTAKAYINAREKDKAKKLLLSVPKVCRESYDKSMSLYETIK
ncbi:MAG: hypothetical protein WBG43_08780 [Marinifilaceae bacterium]